MSANPDRTAARRDSGSTAALARRREELAASAGFAGWEEAIRQTATLSYPEAAAALRCGIKTIWKWRAEFGLTTPQQATQPRGYATRRAAIEGTASMTLDAAADQLGISRATLGRWREIYGHRTQSRRTMAPQTVVAERLRTEQARQLGFVSLPAAIRGTSSRSVAEVAALFSVSTRRVEQWRARYAPQLERVRREEFSRALGYRGWIDAVLRTADLPAAEAADRLEVPVADINAARKSVNRHRGLELAEKAEVVVRELVGRGWSRAAIAAASGVTEPTVGKLAAGKVARVLEGSGDRLLELLDRPTPVVRRRGGERVPVEPTRRVVLALRRGGASQSEVAALLGESQIWVSAIERGKARTVSPLQHARAARFQAKMAEAG